VNVLRPLFEIYIGAANETQVYDWARLGLPELFTDSALYCLLMSGAGTALGTMGIGAIDVVNG
jgi:hypothetical protein